MSMTLRPMCQMCTAKGDKEIIWEGCLHRATHHSHNTQFSVIQCPGMVSGDSNKK